MKKKLYIFDLDGTILDTLKDLAISVNYALAVFDFPPLSDKEVADRTGNGVQRLVELSVPSGTDTKTTFAVLDVFKQHYFYHCADHTRPYDGIKDVICEIRKQGAKCAVVSNKMDSAVQELAKDYFDGLFDFVAGQKDGVRKKTLSGHGVACARYVRSAKRRRVVYRRQRSGHRHRKKRGYGLSERGVGI